MGRDLHRHVVLAVPCLFQNHYNSRFPSALPLQHIAITPATLQATSMVKSSWIQAIFCLLFIASMTHGRRGPLAPEQGLVAETERRSALQVKKCSLGLIYPA